MRSKRRAVEEMVPRQQVRDVVTMTPFLLALIGGILYLGLIYTPGPEANCFPCFMDFMTTQMLCYFATAILGTILWHMWRDIL